MAKGQIGEGRRSQRHGKSPNWIICPWIMGITWTECTMSSGPVPRRPVPRSESPNLHGKPRYTGEFLGRTVPVLTHLTGRRHVFTLRHWLAAIWKQVLKTPKPKCHSEKPGADTPGKWCQQEPAEVFLDGLHTDECLPRIPVSHLCAWPASVSAIPRDPAGLSVPWSLGALGCSIPSSILANKPLSHSTLRSSSCS